MIRPFHKAIVVVEKKSCDMIPACSKVDFKSESRNITAAAAAASCPQLLFPKCSALTLPSADSKGLSSSSTLPGVRISLPVPVR